ncbi:hypothetical protein LPJ38_27875 [Bradyrhizobium daqingense]|uniref:Uncharacterized protein n=1 Tax=Bradyrhizobium daqingense TaxID=993502 RepID=A0A562LM17_9BRAD|nr:hypothetical protein [Bradyrhizobium daqingense]TWI08641.1 hypothetical protein IQ17_01462 [Bradyrhizobium daqingense]UFS87435.1 hypothetical protein LPJ38_27875 [Bradyrhizobium daqingense]
MPKLAQCSLSSYAQQVDYARRVIREARELLAASQVDTFLGRQSYEPFARAMLDPADGEGDTTVYDR